MIEVLATGPLASVQDLGRLGYADEGVGRSGAADAPAHRLANRLVGNLPDQATIELTMGGLRIRLGRAVTVAMTGARAPVTVRSEGGRGAVALPWQAAITLRAGTVLRVGTPASGVRSYLAVRGGIAVPAVLESRSTDTLSGLGPPLLRPGTVLPIGDAVAADPSDDQPLRRRSDQDPVATVGLLAGPRADWFVAGSLDVLAGAAWAVRPDSNRIGLRLAGPVLRRQNPAELASEPTLPGAIQVPPDGQPIVLGPDSPVTGGYPVIGVVRRADLAVLAQLRPGDAVRFVVVDTAGYAI
jgi:biotin-dependent carboxylase-like uncharacterized protein